MPDLLQPQPPPSWRQRLTELLPLVTPLRVVAAVVAVAVAAGAGFLFLRPASPPPELVLPRADSATPSTGVAEAGDPGGRSGSGAATESSGSAGGVVTVHAAGRVTAPGVYSLPAGARVADVITAAGGLAAEADIDALNLAAKVADGNRVYVPRTGERTPPGGADGVSVGGGPGGEGSGSSPGAGSSGGTVDLNSATAAELDALPGVGPATASAILTYRARHGRFKSVTELLEVPGIGPAKLEALRPRVTVG